MGPLEPRPENNPKPISEVIKERIEKDIGLKNIPANGNISKYMDTGEIDLLQEEIQEKFQGVLDSLIINPNDHNTSDTARRVAKMFIKEIFSGRYTPTPAITDFPNVGNYDELYIAGPITLRSTCAHHFQAIKGKVWIGIFPGKKVIGLSKFNRLVYHIASRPQIQEEMTIQIADAVEDITGASGVAVVSRAEHQCVTHRGVMEHESDMITSVMRGKFRKDPALKQEFFNLIRK